MKSLQTLVLYDCNGKSPVVHSYGQRYAEMKTTQYVQSLPWMTVYSLFHVLFERNVFVSICFKNKIKIKFGFPFFSEKMIWSSSSSGASSQTQSGRRKLIPPVNSNGTLCAPHGHGCRTADFNYKKEDDSTVVGWKYETKGGRNLCGKLRTAGGSPEHLAWGGCTDQRCNNSSHIIEYCNLFNSYDEK